jgi:hypothetical protein
MHAYRSGALPRPGLPRQFRDCASCRGASALTFVRQSRETACEGAFSCAPPRHRRKRLRDIGERDLMPRGIAQFHVPAHMLDQGSGAGRCCHWRSDHSIAGAFLGLAGSFEFGPQRCNPALRSHSAAARIAAAYRAVAPLYSASIFFWLARGSWAISPRPMAE